MTKKFPLWINNCHIFAHFVQFWPCYFFSMPFYGRQPTWHEKLVKICGIANFLNFNLAKSNFWLVAICPIKRHLDYLFRMEEVLIFKTQLSFRCQNFSSIGSIGKKFGVFSIRALKTTPLRPLRVMDQFLDTLLVILEGW